MREFKLEAPAETQRRAVQSHTKDLEDFGKAHPHEWFIAREAKPVAPAYLPAQHKQCGRRFAGAFWERKYRTKIVDGDNVKLTYLRYVGPT
jgi:hypothetical protein